MRTIESVIKLIKEQIGVELELCDHFTGLRDSQLGKHFNVVLKDRISESQDYIKLERFCKKYGCFKIEPNGLKRVSIFI
jgi:hypothetical protein